MEPGDRASYHPTRDFDRDRAAFLHKRFSAEAITGHTQKFPAAVERAHDAGRDHMSTDLDQVYFARARWCLSYLVPYWTFSIAILLCLMGVSAYRLLETTEHWNDAREKTSRTELVWECTTVTFSLVTLLLSTLEITKITSETLTPFLLLCSHIVKMTLALVNVGLGITVHVQNTDGKYSIAGLALDCGLIAATFPILLYAFLTYRRLLKYKDYDLTGLGLAKLGTADNSALELGSIARVTCATLPERIRCFSVASAARAAGRARDSKAKSKTPADDYTNYNSPSVYPDDGPQDEQSLRRLGSLRIPRVVVSGEQGDESDGLALLGKNEGAGMAADKRGGHMMLEGLGRV